MAGNKRGKLKEHFEGMHRNFDWVNKHCIESLELIQDGHPHLSEGIKQITVATAMIDKLAKDVYDRI